MLTLLGSPRWPEEKREEDDTERKEVTTIGHLEGLYGICCRLSVNTTHNCSVQLNRDEIR